MSKNRNDGNSHFLFDFFSLIQSFNNKIWAKNKYEGKNRGIDKIYILSDCFIWEEK